VTARVKLVKVRLSGDAAALGAALTLLVSAVQGGDAEIAEQSALYPNRRDPGCRVYLTLAVPDGTGTGQRGPVRRRQAIRKDGAA
jgi:hypothetical protein